jgi:Na+/H+ antiporter
MPPKHNRVTHAHYHPCGAVSRLPPTSAGLALTSIDVAFLLLALMLLTGLVARRSSVPAPIVFSVVGFACGVAWHLVPALPPVVMSPDIVLFAFLPPLLTVAAYALPLKAFKRNLLPIGLLAIGLVLLTTAVAAVVSHALVGLTWAAAFVLGAIIAPPDPVAATAVAGKTGLAHRLVVILEGEGLVNDAVAIIAYGLALEAVRTGQFSWGHALWSLLRETPTGIVIGLLVGWGTGFVRQRIDSVPLEVGISLATPYLAFHLADRLGCSGVLAVVTLGFMLRASSRRVASPVARLAARTVWSFLRYATTALVFLLLGLMMGQISAIWPSWELIRAGLILAGVVVVIRIAWMMIVPRLAAAAGLPSDGNASTAEQFVVGWSGMRGVVSLALALALPLTMGGNGETRPTIIFMTLVVIAVTLVVQGATLSPLVRWLKVGDSDRDQREEAEARQLAGRAGIEAVNALRASSDAARAVDAELAQCLYVGEVGIGGSAMCSRNTRHRRALLIALHAQRDVVDDLRDAGRMGSALAERLDTELDLEAMGAVGDGKRLTDAGEEE